EPGDTAGTAESPDRSPARVPVQAEHVDQSRVDRRGRQARGVDVVDAIDVRGRQVTPAQQLTAGLGAERRRRLDISGVLLVETVVRLVPLRWLAESSGPNPCVGEQRQQAIDMRDPAAETCTRELGRSLLIHFVRRLRRHNVNELGHAKNYLPIFTGSPRGLYLIALRRLTSSAERSMPGSLENTLRPPGSRCTPRIACKPFSARNASITGCTFLPNSARTSCCSCSACARASCC